MPAGLMDRILAKTGPGHRTTQPVMAGAGAMALPMPAWQRPGLMGSVRRWAEPRLMMTVAMAFFSIALTLNLTGVRVTRFRLSSLRPTAVRSYMERQLNMASIPIIRYYDHLRLFYEVQSGMQQLRGDSDSTPQQGSPENQSQPAGSGQSKKKDGGSRVETPHHSGEPARANADSFGGYVDTSFRQRNGRARREEIKEMTLTIRAFRRLQGPTGSRASERSRVWTA